MSTSRKTKPGQFRVRGRGWRIGFMALLALPTSALAMWALFEIFRPNQLTWLELAQLALSLPLFVWLSCFFLVAMLTTIL